MIEDLVWQQICEYVQHPEVAEEALKEKFDVCRQAERVAELAQLKSRLNELKIGEQKLLVKYGDPANGFTEEALSGAVSEIREGVKSLQAQISALDISITLEEDLIRKVGDVRDILTALKESIKNTSIDTKRKIFELLVKEIKVGILDGTPCLNIVYWFDKELIEANPDFQLHSSRMSVQIFRQIYLLEQFDSKRLCNVD